MSFPDQGSLLEQVASDKTCAFMNTNKKAAQKVTKGWNSKYAPTKTPISTLSKNLKWSQLRCKSFKPDLYNFSQIKALEGLKYK